MGSKQERLRGETSRDQRKTDGTGRTLFGTLKQEGLNRDFGLQSHIHSSIHEYDVCDGNSKTTIGVGHRITGVLPL